MPMPPFSNSPDVSVLRAPERRRRFLIMVRCGSGVRPSFFNQTPAQDREFDLACNYFAPPHADDLFHEHAEYLVAGGLSKFHAAKHFLQAIGAESYEGAWFLDDDIELHCDASEFLRFCADNRFAIAQPALTQASDSFWKITYQHPAFEYRLTNFVEVMAPYFARDFLREVAAAFDISISTYGLEVFWGTKLGERPAAVIDRFLMSHLRRRNVNEGAYYAYLRSIDIDCFTEMKSVFTLLGLEQYDIRLKGGMEIIETMRVR